MNIEEYWTHPFQAMDLHIPSKNLTSRFNLPWVNQHIKKMIRKKERLYKVAKKYQTKEHWDKFKQYRKAVKTELDLSHKKFIFDMLEVSPSTSEALTNTQDQYRIGKNNYSREPGTVTTLLKEFKLTPLETRRKIARITLFHKAIHEKVAIPTPSHILKPRKTSRLHQPNTKRYVQIRPNKDIYKYSFFPMTIRDWNKLPDELLEIESSEEFKTKLTKLLCSG
ncbi:unnamed protein product [Mytilus coruscus]|uniref:Uncharacterized protein n=1 Tax=Mytilus coruscus TaxID=42192 RepID=A0A6J8ELH9_MYTCO|nr:unnamed protein product [Mytilus coruscus]